MWHGDPATTQRGLGGGWLREIRGVGRGARDQKLAMSAMVPLLCYSPGGFLLVEWLAFCVVFVCFCGRFAGGACVSHGSELTVKY